MAGFVVDEDELFGFVVEPFHVELVGVDGALADGGTGVEGFFNSIEDEMRIRRKEDLAENETHLIVICRRRCRWRTGRIIRCCVCRWICLCC